MKFSELLAEIFVYLFLSYLMFALFWLYFARDLPALLAVVIPVTLFGVIILVVKLREH